MNKTAIKNFAIWARRKLISDITFRAGMLGISENGIAQPMKQSTKDVQFFDIGTKDYVEISGAEIQQRNALLAAIRNKERTSDYKTAFRSVVEEVAYTWFNRLIAVRFMEVNDYLPSHVRVLSSSNPNKLEPDFVTTPFETDLEFSPYETDIVLQLKDQNKLDELFRFLFIKQCNKLGEILPELFEKISDYTELLLTISFTDKDGVIYHLAHDISEDDFNVEKEGQVEIIGWMYQYYNTEPKDKVFENLKKNIKIRKEDIPAATQLFTPDWIVRYMVENSLGRLWVEGHPNDDLKATWKYYLEEAEQEPDVQVQLARIREEYTKINPEDIKLIDPCMGSGHILVYAFDVLMQIYTSYGYTQRDAAKSILQNNIYGIDIDTRAYQLAYFAVMMKARQYNRRIFNEGILPNLMAVKNPTPCSSSSLKRLGDLKDLGNRLIEDFRDAEEYGSILQLNYTQEELDTLDNRLAEIHEMSSYGNLLVQMESMECVNTLAPLIRQARIMSQKYDVVVTNPPYMGLKQGMTAKLSDYVVNHYPDSKSDLYAVFIDHLMECIFPNGFLAMITQHSWMFQSFFRKIRSKVLKRDIVNMAHLGARAFEEIAGEVVQTTAFIVRLTDIPKYKASYVRLLNGESREKERAFLDYNEVFLSSKLNYRKIDDEPISYWLSDKIYDAFNNKKVSDYGYSFQGIITGQTEQNLKLWFEPVFSSITFGNQDTDVLDGINTFFPYMKGGSFRRWYGNKDYIIHWHNAGKHFTRSRTENRRYFFKKGLTWSDLSTGLFSCREVEKGYLFDASGPMLFIDNDDNYDLLLGYLNSKVFQVFLNINSQGLHYGNGAIVSLPAIIEKRNCSYIIRDCVELSKDDWNSFETSWDFQRHPLIVDRRDYIDQMTLSFNSQVRRESVSLISKRYEIWEKTCENRFNQLKANEEELNRIFIDIYGLQNELTPEVEDKDITVRKANLQRDVKSLISFAVGCMFGRYSLDTPGLSFAGGEWDDSKYHSYLPDPDNCIPITDEEYFQDDIVGRFVEFIRTVYGAATLEENLEFIATALGNGGTTARDTIRQYFLKDFFKDHCQTYSVTGSGKRPIYWLFDSGKQNGFKALVYMHRWNADTVGNLRVEYLHKMQTVYEKEIENCQDAIDNSLNNREIAVATKRKEKLVKQLKECKDYDAKVAHIALSRIDIDLDDGVKVNYRKVQTGADGRFCEILADSKDIMVKEDSPIWQSLISSR